MTQEEKDLLLKDLSARLMYGVVMNVTEPEDDSVIFDCLLGLDVIKEMAGDTSHFRYKPYLRPMDSMTEEECIELGNLSAIMENVGEHVPNVPYYIEIVRPEQFDWLNAHHFDYRGLIEKGLALKTPEGLKLIYETLYNY